MRMLNVPRSRVGFNVRKVEILTELAALLNHPRARDLGGVPATKIAKNLGLTTKLVLTLLERWNGFGLVEITGSIILEDEFGTRRRVKLWTLTQKGWERTAYLQSLAERGWRGIRRR